jgi:phytoene dehydrogenase-like protein
MVVNTCNPSTQRLRQEDQGWGHTSVVEHLAPALKKKKVEVSLGYTVTSCLTQNKQTK